jgi:hypothetical protein
MSMKAYQQLARSFVAWQNCVKSKNEEWTEKHMDAITNTIDNYLPHGSGFDTDTKLDYDASSKNHLVLYGSFHSMDEMGGYDGWIDFSIIVEPSLSFGFKTRISGRFGKKQDLKTYIVEFLSECLNKEIESLTV